MIQARKRDRIIVVAFSLAVLLITAFFWVRGRFLPLEQNTAKTVFVLTEQPVQTDIERNLTVPAILEPILSVAIVPRVSGLLLDVKVEEGNTVESGDLLALVDPQPYEMELLSAKSAWMLSESRLERISQLYESSGASRQQLDEVRTARDAAYSSYELAKMRREYAEVRATSNGLILSRFADPGSMASTEQPLFVIGDADRLQLKLEIPEKYWDLFNAENLPRVRVFRPGIQASGSESAKRDAEILRVGSSISPETRTFEVVCSPDSGEPSWPLGIRLHVEFVLDERSRVWALPRRALSGTGVLWWVDTSTDTVHKTEPGEYFYNDQLVAVPEQWAERQFVTEGYERLIEGQLVSTLSEGA